MAFAYESHDHYVRDSKGNAVRYSKGNPVKTSNALKDEEEPKKKPTLEEFSSQKMFRFRISRKMKNFLVLWKSQAKKD